MDNGATEREIFEEKMEKKLQDPNAEPMYLPLEFLKVITSDFSTERELGRGAYGVVYKGVLQSGKAIAVKKIFDAHLLDSNNKFENEITCLMGVRHQNVVQLVGYCVQTRLEVMKLPSGEHVMVEIPACLLCFEFHCKGSLDKHVSDDLLVLGWDMRYEIIRGVCRGLHYLHDKCHIVHLDLKPQSILMDAMMIPKIVDFGLSRLLGEQKSKTVTTNFAGTLGYMAQEYIDRGIISPKADIFSLGVIIIEIITGRRDYPNIGGRTETSLKHFTEEVVGSWRKRLELIPMHMSSEMHIQQVEQCISIALKCLEPDSNKRPTSLDIVQSLNAEETKSRSLENSTSVAEKSDRGATVVFNKDDSSITCSCRMFESIGILCKHALRVFNTNAVYNLPLQYILPRWTKYVKSGFYIEKQGTEKEDLKTRAAVISREATSLAMKCLPSKELLDKLQKAIHNLNLEADTYLSELHEKSNEVPPTPNECVRQPLNGVISFKIPQVIKGPKNTRFKNVVEKKPGKKKGAQKKGEDLNNDVEKRDEHADPKQMTDSNVGPSSAMAAPLVQGGYANSTMPIMAAPFMQGGYANSTMAIMAAPSTMPHLNSIANPSGMATPYIPGGYTSLLFGVDQDATMQTTVRKLHFDGVQNHENM